MSRINKERKMMSFTLSKEAREKLNTLPEGIKSMFVDKAILATEASILLGKPEAKDNTIVRL